MKNIEVITKISWDTFISLAERFNEIIGESDGGAVSLSQAETLEQLAAQIKSKATALKPTKGWER